ncbi:2-dehydro-3-deoxygalactonokinase [Brucella sp. BE17]|uniref:2-dehydro-3-deoxygalactonokinase n=1 Tax=Brucella sp. BE17 TaxID=3142977 RepID=UPI0031BA46B6
MTENKAQKPAFVGVDWGTSSFRAWLMSAAGHVLSESKSSEGMLHCAENGFATALAEHLEKLNAPTGLPVLICGMAGARQGWVEAPYCKTPTVLDSLHLGSVAAPFEADVRILPGLAQADENRPDVMRGEETQLLGAIDSDFSGLVCIPGTHSKWVRISRGAVKSFTTYMTGELFSILSSHSILKHAVDRENEGALKSSAFFTGVEKGLENPKSLTSSLFGLRASQLLGFSERADGIDGLSGLLIGVEIADAVEDVTKNEALILIGSGRLASLYAKAMRHAGYEPVSMDAEAASRDGLHKAACNLWNKDK